MHDLVAMVSAVVGYAAAAYLAYRACVALLRVRWARHAYPVVESSAAASEWQQRCRGALLGLAMGDAVNLPAESLPRWLARLRYPGGPRPRRGFVRFARRAGDVSDDTQLTICVARSIGLDGTYSHARFLDELGCWSYFRVGAGKATTRAAVRARRRGDPCGAARSEGNGVAIRVAPLAIANAAGGDHELIALVEGNGRATHDSDAAIRAGAFVALLVKMSLARPRGAFDDVDELRAAIQAASDASGFDLRLPAHDAEANDVALAARLREVGTSGHVGQCVPAAIWVLLHHRLNFRAAMRSIFRAGGDTDSIGAIVGAVIGAQLGVGGLPSEWSRVQHRDYLCWLADRLAVPTAAPEGAGVVDCVVGDVAARPVDVVVNAWNRNVIPPWLLLPQGVSRAIRRAGGAAAIRAVGRRAPLPLGTATETGAAQLRSRWIVHVAGIDLLWRASEASVSEATRSALLLARWLGARSVALPLIGAGSGGLNERVVEALMRAELQTQSEHFDRLELVRLEPPL